MINAGSDVVDWLHTRVHGLDERRDARKLASQLLRSGYIRHTVNKYTFSEQCYYVFGDLCTGEVLYRERKNGADERKCARIINLFSTGVASLRLTDDAASEADRDTLAPLPLPSAPWGGGPGSTGGISHSNPPHVPYYPTGYAPMPYSYSSDPLGGTTLPSTFSYGREGSVHSGSGKIRFFWCACSGILISVFSFGRE